MTPSDWMSGIAQNATSTVLILIMLFGLLGILYFIVRLFMSLARGRANWFNLIYIAVIFSLCAFLLQYGPPTLMRSAQRGIHNSMPYMSLIAKDVTAYTASRGEYANVLVDQGFDTTGGVIAFDLPSDTPADDTLAASVGYDVTQKTRFDPERRVVYILAPTSAVNNPQLMQSIMQSAINGLALTEGLTGGNHTISFTVEDAFDNLIRNPNPKSRLIIVNGYAIGTGIDEVWLNENYPEMVDRTRLVYIKE